MSKYNEAAKRGATLLDEAIPDWWKAVDVFTIDMARVAHCVLGHVYGDYWLGAEALTDHLEIDDFDSDYAAVYGFDIDLDDAKTSDDYAEQYGFLRAAWHYEIRDREEAALAKNK